MLCVNDREGEIELVADKGQSAEKDAWRGVCVYADHNGGAVRGVTLELLGKAVELARKVGHPVYALLIGHRMGESAEKLLKYGADKVFVYDDPMLEYFKIEPYTNVFEDFIKKVKPSAVLFGATVTGRALAPRVAARLRTGLTAGCTTLGIKENTDLVQIRPTFGGDIMAQIVTEHIRPQLCTVRPKVFSAPAPFEHPVGEIIKMGINPKELHSLIKIQEIVEKPKEIDITEADRIVAAGRGVKTKEDLKLVQQLADAIGAQVACSLPLSENGWFSSKYQIGISGRTVKPKLIITAGVSGAVQFKVGMRNSDYIVAINSDPDAPIFEIAHCGIVGDLYEVIPRLIDRIKGNGN